MPSLRRDKTFIVAPIVLAFVCLIAFASKKKETRNAPQMEESKRALHALERLSFGPRRGDVERVTALGVEKWIDLQLHPEKIEDSNLEARLAPLRTLRMDTREIVDNFPPQPVIKAVMEGRRPMPSVSTSLTPSTARERTRNPTGPPRSVPSTTPVQRLPRRSNARTSAASARAHASGSTDGCGSGAASTEYH